MAGAKPTGSRAKKSTSGALIARFCGHLPDLPPDGKPQAPSSERDEKTPQNPPTPCLWQADISNLEPVQVAQASTDLADAGFKRAVADGGLARSARKWTHTFILGSWRLRFIPGPHSAIFCKVVPGVALLPSCARPRGRLQRRPAAATRPGRADGQWPSRWRQHMPAGLALGTWPAARPLTTCSVQVN